MIMSRDENIVRNGNIKIGNLSFEEVEKFKYLGATVTNINDTREEIKHTINMGNACYYSVEELLSSSLLSKNLKVRIYKTVILPVVLYGCETWTLTLREEHSLRVFENKVVVITEDVQNVHLLLEYRLHIDVSLTCEHDPKLQEYCVCPQNVPQFDSEGIPNQAPETNKPMILNGPTSRNREGSDQDSNYESLSLSYQSIVLWSEQGSEISKKDRIAASFIVYRRFNVYVPLGIRPRTRVTECALVRVFMGEEIFSGNFGQCMGPVPTQHRDAFGELR
ncbi:hypothetical protein ANN_09563 [Periplaneta americana]|uniref:Uncharacterized protein n=1 Tax=Periplaneta americana TaxID=6978 RepID=A0ABQ8TNQ8_PERAM|nr:hypothetical protein ANN_09563 [Periplaneta americana]